MDSTTMEAVKTEFLREGTPIQDTLNKVVNDPEIKFSVKEASQLLAQHGAKFYEACMDLQDDQSKAKVAMPVSSVLDHIMERDENSKLSGFDRLLQYHGIPVQNAIESGVYAGTMDLFFRTDVTSALVPEFINRTLRKQAEEEYSLGDMVAELILTPNNTYKQPKLDLSNTSTGMKRVGEFTRSPVARLAFTEDSKTIGDRSVSLQISYRTWKDVPINMFVLFLKRVALQDNEDLVGLACETLETAAGAATPKTSLNASDTGTNTLMYETWLKMTARSGGHKWDRAICDQATAIKILGMQRPSPDWIQLVDAYAAGQEKVVGSGVRMSKRRWVPCELIDNEAVTDWTIVPFDRDYALLHVKEIGVKLTEIDKVINGRFNEIVITDSDDFCVFDSTAVKAYTI